MAVKTSDKQKFNYQGKEFELAVVTDGDTLARVVITCGGLDYPYANYDKASEFLVDEYGGTKEEAIKVLEETYAIGELKGDKIVKLSQAAAGKKREPKIGKPATPKNDSLKVSNKANSETKKNMTTETSERTFVLPGRSEKRTIRVTKVAEGVKPENMEDVMLDEETRLHIDVYSAKSRISTLDVVKAVEGKEVKDYTVEKTLIAGVSLMDAIYAYAEKAGMSFQKADKYIKIKRGLLVEKVKAPKDVTKTDKKDTKKADSAQPKESEVAKTAEEKK